MQVQTLINPTFEKFSEVQKSVQPNFLYFQGEQLENEGVIGSLTWGTSDPQEVSLLISAPLPTIVSILLFPGFVT